jgi:hypothetical protein
MILSKSTGFGNGIYITIENKAAYRVVCGVSRVRRGEGQRDLRVYIVT